MKSFDFARGRLVLGLCCCCSVPSGLMTGLSHTTYNRWQLAVQTRHSVTHSEVQCYSVQTKEAVIPPLGVRKVQSY